jgi:hypothetical protein
VAVNVERDSRPHLPAALAVVVDEQRGHRVASGGRPPQPRSRESTTS